ncbi:MAG: hypothetical protein PHC62_08585 [Candidatus Izemoplasmatales bacterium]|jgi:competence protein ComGC|nr:hypothetical protein [Candidatus Izemoplasmatales bacterium]
MNNMKKKGGFALVDVLGAIVIFGIATILILNILNLLFRGQQSIFVAEDKTTTGLLITREIENKLLAFEPTNVSLCEFEDNCLVFEKQYSYEYNPDNKAIEKVSLSPYLQLVIRMTNNQIDIGSDIISTSPYLIHSNSYVTITNNTFTTSANFYISLEDNLGIITEFVAMYSIPTNQQN